jgi:DNA-directed RNA polymerase specialized sigma24 family protein
MSPSDESRVEELYRREFAQYVRVASSITRDAEVSRDVVQEAFARSLQKAGGLVDERALAAWVWRTVIRLAVERSRQEQRSFPELVMPDESPRVQWTLGVPGSGCWPGVILSRW